MLNRRGRGKRTWFIVTLAVAVSQDAWRPARGRASVRSMGTETSARRRSRDRPTYNAVSQEFALAAGGVNMWAARDEFHFVWKRMTGDFILQARVQLLGQGVDPHRKAGWMVRPSQDADAAYVDGVVHGDGLTSLQFRRTKGAVTAADRAGREGRRRPPARTQGRHLHLLRGEVRRPVHHRRRSRTSAWATTCSSGWRCARTMPT